MSTPLNTLKAGEKWPDMNTAEVVKRHTWRTKHGVRVYFMPNALFRLEWVAESGPHTVRGDTGDEAEKKLSALLGIAHHSEEYP